MTGSTGHQSQRKSSVVMPHIRAPPFLSRGGSGVFWSGADPQDVDHAGLGGRREARMAAGLRQGIAQRRTRGPQPHTRPGPSLTHAKEEPKGPPRDTVASGPIRRPLGPSLIHGLKGR